MNEELGVSSPSAPTALAPASQVEPASGLEQSRSSHDAALWTQAEAIALCREIEAVCPPFGCHVALTGGTLYKDGPRKDLDILFYRIRQTPEIDMDGLWDALTRIGVDKSSGFGWCHKATYHGRKIDCFFPEDTGDDYPDTEEDDLNLTLADFDMQEAPDARV